MAASAIYIDADILWARLLRRVVRTESGCWQWQGAVNSRGYGCIGSGRGGKTITTHRLSVIVRDGSIADGLTVDHQCHNSDECQLDADCPHRRCVNPAHLKVMTSGENSARRFEGGVCRKGHPLTRRPDGRARECATCRQVQRAVNPEVVAARAWAVEQGMRVPAVGRLSNRVLADFRAHTASRELQLSP